MNTLQRYVGALLLISGVCTSASEAPTQVSMGDGSRNWIVTEDAQRSGATFTFSEVQIDGNGWLVMHPFEDGKPNGALVAGSTYVRDGLSRGVNIELTSTPQPGERYIVMLHSDVDEDQEFDFVFVGDTGHVMDRAVFEGQTMIGHVIEAL